MRDATRRYRFGAYVVDTSCATLFRDDEPLELRPKAFDTLVYLIQRNGRLSTKDELIASLWPNVVVTDDSLFKCIREVREALGDSNHELIRTVPRRGYIFSATVSIESKVPDRVVADPVGQTVQTPGARRQPRQRAYAARLTAFAVIAAAAVLVGSVGGLGQRWFGIGGDTGQIRSLAVLPFDNVSNDPAQEYFVDGMTEELITALSNLVDVRVVSRTSIKRYKNTSISIPDVARELGVDAIVEGGAQSIDGRITVTARLIRAHADETVWANRYDGDLEDVLTLQSDIVLAIGREIRAELAPRAERRLAAAQAVDPLAYQLTLQGRFDAEQLSVHALERSIERFEQAIAVDPSYAPAHAGLAFAYLNLANVYLPPLEVMPRAREAALRATELDPGLAEAHTWAGYIALFFDWDWDTAERELQLARDLNPSSADARLIYANYLVSLGRMDEGIDEIRRAQLIDPVSVASYSSLYGSQWNLFMARRYAESIEDGKRALEIDSTYPMTHAHLGLAYVHYGEHGRGIDALEHASGLEDTAFLKALRAYAYAVAGRDEEARQLIDEVAEISRREYTCAYEIAVTYAALDEPDETFTWLEKAVADRADCIPYMNIDPRLDSIRGDSRFDLLLERVGFAQ